MPPTGVWIQRAWGRLLLAAAVLLLLPGCSTYYAYRVRFHEPDYVVTPAYYQRAPQRVAILPFLSRTANEQQWERAQICRRAFYQHFSIRNFEDVELHALDRRLVPVAERESPRFWRHMRAWIQNMDVVGVTSVWDIDGWREKGNGIGALLRDWVKVTRKDLDSDAYVAGFVRGYGRLYAVVFSSIGLATQVEFRDAKDDALLWRARYKQRNIALPIILDPLDLPRAFWSVFQNTRGEALDLLAYQTYRDVLRTLPAGGSSNVWIRADRPKTRVFQSPTLWTFWPQPTVPKGTRLKFLWEQRGWYQGQTPDGKPVWMLVRDGTLVDEAGNPL